jgi:tetratricopeptide (TPR) repeat protein
MAETTSRVLPRVGNAWLFAVLALLTVTAFLPVWKNGFVDIDDDWYITANPRVIQGWTPQGFEWAWTTFRGKYWQPLSWLSLQLDAHLFSTQSAAGERVLSPAAFHGQSLCWHVASVLLLFALWQRLTGARWRSFLVAALFAVHPMRVESVAWATERKDVLSVFFGILTLWAYGRYAEKRSWWRYLAVAAAFSLSLLSKPMLMTLPFMLLLLDYWPLCRMSSAVLPDGSMRSAPAPLSVSRLLLEKALFFALAAGIAVVTAIARDQTKAAVPLSDLPMSARLANALTAYGSYVLNTFYPVHLAVLYPHPLENWSMASVLAGAGLLLVISLISLRMAKQWPWLIVGWFWFVVALLPVIGFAQGGPQALADRFCYWPHIGLFVAVAWGLGELVERQRIPSLFCGIGGASVLGCLAVLTWIQVGFWHDPLTLWQRALAVTERNAEAHDHLGKYYLERGQVDEAEYHFAEAFRIEPRSLDHRRSLSITLQRPGRVAQSAAALKRRLCRTCHHVGHVAPNSG